MLVVGSHGLVVAELIEEGLEQVEAILEWLWPGSRCLLTDKCFGPALSRGGAWVHGDVV